MEDLPAEILLSIAESSSTLPELLKYRQISRRFRQVVNDSCKSHAFHLLRSRSIPGAADDALLAIRLKRVPMDSCCHYDPAKGDYSFYPSEEFFQAVMLETQVPSGYPSVPAATWFEEVEAVKLKNRFGLRYESKRLDLLEIDYGILEPRHELEVWG